MSDLLDEAHEFLLCMDKTEYADALFALRAELAEANGGRRLADDALQQAQRALYRWLPSCDGGKYDDLIKNDAQYLFGLEHDASAREIGSEILAELTEARRQLKEASEQVPVGCMSPEQFSILTGDPVDNGVHVRIWQVYNPPSRAKSGVKLYAAPVPAQPTVAELATNIRPQPLAKE